MIRIFQSAVVEAVLNHHSILHPDEENIWHEHVRGEASSHRTATIVRWAECQGNTGLKRRGFAVSGNCIKATIGYLSSCRDDERGANICIRTSTWCSADQGH